MNFNRADNCAKREQRCLIMWRHKQIL